MNNWVYICCGTGCMASGGLKIYEAFKKELGENVNFIKDGCGAKATGCNGFCENGVIVKIMPQDISYYKVKESDVSEIIDKTIINGELIQRLLYKNDKGEYVKTQNENPFYAHQHKYVLQNIGLIDPLSIDEYIERGGYEALKKALEMTPNEIIDEITNSGLKGRGGAGFPTGAKWRQAASYDTFPKYVVLNGDEGDPGAFMDRSILEGDPHSVIEGMTICALAIGAKQGFMYIRDEYSLALKNISAALNGAYEKGILGRNVMGSEFEFNIRVFRGGGAFVCGESTALMASIEGRVGLPRAKYIRSVQKGLWDNPTVLNNVETLANVPKIILNGAKNFSEMGIENCKGTKVFALVGKVKRTGLVEVAMGITLRKLIYEIGGGVLGGRPFKAVQTGGPSGGCLPDSLLDLPIDFDTLSQHSSMMGSGGLIVMDDRTCMVEVARYYVKFLSEESCGKCVPCREGLRRMLEILTAIIHGFGKEEDILELEEIGETLQDAALCGLGKTAANPVLSTLKYFKNEYLEHIENKFCPSGVCTHLIAFEIQQDKCKGCSMCYKNCPANAISGETKKPHIIDKSLCISCGACRDICKFDAVKTIKR